MSPALGTFPPEQALRKAAGLGIDLQADEAKEAVEIRRAVRVGSFQFLLDQSIPAEVIDVPPCYPLPNAPDYCVGLTSWRGFPIPVFDLHRATGADGHDNVKLIVLQLPSGPVSYAIDGLPQIVFPEQEPELQALNIPKFLAPAVKRAVGSPEQPLLTLSHERLFSALAATAH